MKRLELYLMNLYMVSSFICLQHFSYKSLVVACLDFCVALI